MSTRILLILFICLLNGLGHSWAQTMKVTGVVYAEDDNEPVMGASVLVKGTRLGTVTHIDGTFVLNDVPLSAKTLEVSFVGMIKTEAAIRPQMTILLKADTRLLDEVMVVAYGTSKKSSYTGSVSLVKNDALKDLPLTSFESALNGKVAGLTVTGGSGQAGSVPSLRIRGNGSMNASNEPLYVVDGVPVLSGDIGKMSDYTYSTNNVLGSLNPEDIESISVLKDAAASSLYGSRAANGVVLITTKHGKEGRPVVGLKASVGFTPCWATDNYEPAGVQEQVNMIYTVFHDYCTSDGDSNEDANSYALNELNQMFNKHGYQFSTSGTGAYENVAIGEYDNSGRGGKYFDWDNAYFRTAVYQTYDLSVSGGTPSTTYYTSLSYTQDQGRIKVNSFDRISGRVNLSQKVGKWMELGTHVSLSRTNKSGYNDTRITSDNLFMQSRNLLWGLYWPTDYKTGEPWTTRFGSYARNQLYYNKEWENESINNGLSAVEMLTLHLMEGLDVKSIFSYDNTTVKDHLYYSANHYWGSSVGGQVNEMRTLYEKVVSSTTASYNHTFGDHTIALLAGFEAEKNKTDFTRSTGEGLPTSTLHTVSTAGTLSAEGYNWGNAMVSILSKMDYHWKERYYASASLRRDGSSRLSPDTRWGNFWSVAGAWRITSEPFMKEVRALNDLRLRASYGVNGTLPTNNYGYINLMSYDNNYLGHPGGTITTLANADLTWETSYTLNLGLDFGLCDNRLRGTIEYFNRHSKDLLQDVPISSITGFGSVLQNIGEINNRGFEVELSGDIVRNRHLTWSAGLNATFLKSRVTQLYNGADIIWYDPTGNDDRAQYLYREGASTLAFYGYEWAGVDPKNGQSVYYVNDPDDPTAGDFEWNGRGATYDYDEANETILGDAIPKVTGGINTHISWKGIDLGLNFIYKIGGKLYDGAYKDVADDGYYWERIRARSYYDNMWTPTRTDGTQPALRGIDLTDSMQYSSRHMHNASFLRLKTLSIGYSLPKSLIGKMMLSSARLFFNASNLLTFSKYKEADPEVNQYGTRGWETPIGKTFVFGIDLKF